jgi:hypothetical protein
MTKNEVLEYLGIPKEEWDSYKVTMHCERSPGCADVYTAEKIK